jgi:O-antigen ligase
LMAISQKPIFGWGVENFSIAFQSVLKDNEFDLKNIRVDKAHNEFLEVATTGGIVAFLIYLLIWFLIVKNLWLRKNEPGMENNLIGLAAFFIIANLNVMSIAEYLFFYFIAGISINGRNKLRPYN